MPVVNGTGLQHRASTRSHYTQHNGAAARYQQEHYRVPTLGVIAATIIPELASIVLLVRQKEYSLQNHSTISTQSMHSMLLL